MKSQQRYKNNVCQRSYIKLFFITFSQIFKKFLKVKMKKGFYICLKKKKVKMNMVFVAGGIGICKFLQNKIELIQENI